MSPLCGVEELGIAPAAVAVVVGNAVAVVDGSCGREILAGLEVVVVVAVHWVVSHEGYLKTNFNQ